MQWLKKIFSIGDVTETCAQLQRQGFVQPGMNCKTGDVTEVVERARINQTTPNTSASRGVQADASVNQCGNITLLREVDPQEVVETFTDFRFLGEGTTGIAYKAMLGTKPMALKVFLPTAQGGDHRLPLNDTEFTKMLDTLEDELLVVRGLNNPNVVRYCDAMVSTRARAVYLVMDFIAGSTFEDFCASFADQKLPGALFPSLWSTAVNGLIGLLDADLAHCDLKSDNFMVSDGKVVIIDLGLACKQVCTNRTEAYKFYGPVAYHHNRQPTKRPAMPLEVWQRGDLVSLALSFLEAAFGASDADISVMFDAFSDSIGNLPAASAIATTFVRQYVADPTDRALIICAMLAPWSATPYRVILEALRAMQLPPTGAQISTKTVRKYHGSKAPAKIGGAGVTKRLR